MTLRSFQFSGMALLLGLLLYESAWTATPAVVPELPDPGSVGISKQQQVELGRLAMAEVYKQMPVLSDSSPQTRYMRQLGKRLARVIPQEYYWPFEFHTIPEKDVNAFALPGGAMFVNVGVMIAAENEAELAGVMAHEMAHVYMQHSAKQASKAQWTSLLGALGGLFGGGTAGSLARLGIQIGAGTLMMKYSRSDEAQADAVGAIIMYKAGYDPGALADFFQKLERQGGGGGPQFLSDHPNPGNRHAGIEKEISKWPSRSYLRSSEAFVGAKRGANAVKTYTGEQIAEGSKQGVWADQNRRSGAIPPDLRTSKKNATCRIANVSFPHVRPARNLTRLKHSAFSISYPENWQSTGDPQSAVTIAPRAGVAGGAIAYGVVIGGVQGTNASSLDQATADLIQTLQQSNPGLRLAGNMQDITVNGLQGRSVNFTGASPIQQNGEALRERDWLVTVARPRGGLLYAVFIGPERDFGQLQPTYERMLDSMQVR